MAHRVAPEAESGLDEIWYYIARESGSVVIADRIIDLITERFFLLGRHSHLGRRRDEERAVCGVFQWANTSIVPTAIVCSFYL